MVGARGNWLNRVQDVLGASITAKECPVEVLPDSSLNVTVSVLIKYGSYASDFERMLSIQLSITGMTGLGFW